MRRKDAKGGSPSTVPATQGVPLRGKFHLGEWAKDCKWVSISLSLNLLLIKNSCPGLREELSWDPERTGEVYPMTASSSEGIVA